MRTAGGSTHPYEEQCVPYDDVSVYECDKCGKHNYRDDFGRAVPQLRMPDGRRHRVSRLRVDRHDHRTTRLPSGRPSAASSATTSAQECRRSLDRGFEDFARKESGGRYAAANPSVSDGEWSFFWSTRDRKDGEWKPYIHGGLIMHGPTPLPQPDGSYVFETYDYGLKAVRPATTEEIDHLRWSVHT